LIDAFEVYDLGILTCDFGFDESYSCFWQMEYKRDDDEYLDYGAFDGLYGLRYPASFRRLTHFSASG